MKKENRKIPKGMALVGFSNNLVSSLIDPPLTTIEQPSYENWKERCETAAGTDRKQP
jgi:LacI family transcriptional regulator